MKLITPLLLVSLVASTALYANQPSFDCNKAKKGSTEEIICSSDTLMDLDRELSSVYKEAKKFAKKSDQIKAMQRGWIKGRDECWKADDRKECIIKEYKYQIKYLEEKYLSSDSTSENASIVQDIVGARGRDGEGILKKRGFVWKRTQKINSSSYTFYKHEKSSQCIRVQTKDGRYASIVDAPASDCNK
ncbi:MAG: DUF1311 domain-containing protein [Sulfurovum sp.]|nr:DUF1311 domain-containing protein [Sulfurovum sp.]